MTDAPIQTVTLAGEDYAVVPHGKSPDQSTR